MTYLEFIENYKKIKMFKNHFTKEYIKMSNEHKKMCSWSFSLVKYILTNLQIPLYYKLNGKQTNKT